MRKFASSHIFGTNLSTLVLPAGSIVTDDSNGKLYVHDGVTIGGNVVASNYTAVNKAGDTMLGLFAETSATNITAGTTRTQAGATALTAQINTVVTSTAPSVVSSVYTFDGVRLPASALGLEIEVINASSYPIKIYGSTASDTIDSVAATTGVIQPPNSMVEYTCYAANAWASEGLGVGYYVPSTNTVGSSLFTESSQDGITAFAGGGSGSATQLWAQTSRVSTVATNGDSVKLPPSAAGLELVVINNGAKYMSVFGFGADTIDGGNASVSQMPGSMSIYSCASSGSWVTNGLGTGYANSLQTLSFADALTATGTTQGTGLAITAGINRFSTVSGTNYGAVLPPAAAGLEIIVTNAHASFPLTVFGAGSDTINTIAATTGVTMMPSSVAFFTATATGAWIATGLGAGYSTSGSFTTSSNATGIVATVGGQGQVPLTVAVNNITTCPASGCVTLPASVPGLQITVANNGANSLLVYPPVGSAINQGATNASTTATINTVTIFFCVSTTLWITK